MLSLGGLTAPRALDYAIRDYVGPKVCDVNGLFRKETARSQRVGFFAPTRSSLPPGVSAPPENRHPVGVAVEWVSQITAIALEIVACIWLGRWLDTKFETTFCSPIGLVIGPVLGFWHLLVLTGVVGRKDGGTGSRDTRRP
jgi:hypothetical protein